MDEIIDNVSWIDANRPSDITLWLLAEHVSSFRKLAEWTATRRAEEWAPLAPGEGSHDYL